MTHQNFGAKNMGMKAECNGKRLSLKTERRETRAWRTASAGAVMCALWRIRKGGKSANRHARAISARQGDHQQLTAKKAQANGSK